MDTYGYAYEVSSPNADKLMSLFRNACRTNGILCTPDDCFAYMRELPEKAEQMTLFDI